MTKWAPRLVSAVGVIGLTLALVYIFAVVLSFRPEGAVVADLMIGRHSGEQGLGLLLVAVPYFLIIVHLLMRTRLSHWLASRGAHEDALEWASQRLDATFTRGRTEAESNRAGMFRSLLALNRLEEARQLLERFPEPEGYGSIRLEGIFWRMQTALRNDDLVSANRLARLSIRGRNKMAGDVEALAAVIAAREGAKTEWQERLDRARWRKASDSMIAWANAVGCARFELADDAPEAIGLLENDAQRLDEDVPGRRAERLVVLAELHALTGEADRALDQRESARAAETVDPRSSRILSDSSPVSE